jgi:hypothetical protein
MSNFGCGQGSRRSLLNLPLVTARPKSHERRQKKSKISVGFVEILGGVTPNFCWCQNVELEKKGSRVTPPVDLNEKPQ